MHNNLRYCIKFHHFLQLAICLMLGTYALLDTGNLFGLFAVVFVPPLYVLLLAGLWRGWFDASWA